MSESAFQSFSGRSPTYAVAMTTTGSTGVQIKSTQGLTTLGQITGARQYYVVNSSTAYMFFTLTNDSTVVAVLPPAASNAAGYVLPPSSAGTFTGPADAWFSGVLNTSTGTAYVCQGEGL